MLKREQGLALGCCWPAQGPEKDVRKQVSIPTLRGRREAAGGRRPRPHACRVCMAYGSRPLTCELVEAMEMEAEGALMGKRNFLGLGLGAAVSAAPRFVGGPCTESRSQDLASCLS